ncbi:MAG: type 1 glutamine amidotransferase domain-containing protein [Polyangiales bacterium]
MAKLGRMRVAAIVADGFEQSELDGPVAALRREGVTVDILAPDERHHDHVKGVNHFDPGPGTKPDRLLEDADPDAYDAILIPGGLASPDTMRQSRAHLDFVKRFAELDKPIFAICHGPWLLADADLIRGKTMTSWPGIKMDLVRAGAKWVDRDVVVDRKLVTSRRPSDIPAFSREALKLLEKEYEELAHPSPTDLESGRVSAPSIA